MMISALSKYSFQSISLNDSKNRPSFMTRHDLKFIIPLEKLDIIWNFLQWSYRVLDVNGTWEQEYENHYYDTEHLNLARDHMRGKRPRYKLRKRFYLNTQDCYWEKKYKEVRGEMIKHRVKGAVKRNVIPFVELGLSNDTYGLNNSLKNKYFRSSFYSSDRKEKVTIDRKLMIWSDNQWVEVLKGYAIIEVKTMQSEESAFVRFLRSYSIRSLEFSKYCFGICILNRWFFPHKRKAISQYIKNLKSSL
ncbi:hypothetical protein OAT16_10440 [Prolixibacteraceae bacterium]|nr:hypothetical protein [Prolixibacteraceae bacterium]